MMSLDSYPVFTENEETLMETSKDDSDINCVQYMTSSLQKVINFDAVKRQYANKLGLSEEAAKSVDAVFQHKNRFVFVEFKNGKVVNRDLKDKLRDSLLIFTDITGKTASYTRENADCIVVYNPGKNPLPNQLKKEKGKVQESASRFYIAKSIAQKAKEEFVRFGLLDYKGLYFREVHTYSTEEFERYLAGE